MIDKNYIEAKMQMFSQELERLKSTMHATSGAIQLLQIMKDEMEKLEQAAKPVKEAVKAEVEKIEAKL